MEKATDEDVVGTGFPLNLPLVQPPNLQLPLYSKSKLAKKIVIRENTNHPYREVWGEPACLVITFFFCCFNHK